MKSKRRITVNTLVFTYRFFVLTSVAACLKFAHADETSDKLAAYMDACVKAKSFNGSVMICKGSETVLKSGYGSANFEHDVPNAPQTKFRIGSITKQFTSFAIMLLAEQDKLTLQDSIVKHLDDAPETWTDITIHHLLTHTSGIPSFTGMWTYRRDMMLPQSLKQMVARFKDEPLEFTPGEKFKYSNSGYFLLGVIIERVSGKTYEEFLQQEMLEPLSMRNTGYDRFRKVLKHRATGYDRSDKGLDHARYLDMSQPYAAGSLYSTVEDLQLWDQALTQGELLSTESYEKMYAPFRDGYAYGWGIGSRWDRKTISHGGGINGFRSHILRIPDEQLCVVVLSNTQPSDPGRIANDLAAIVLGKKYTIPRVRKSVAVDPNSFDALEGEYPIRPNFVLTVKRLNDTLTIQATGQPRFVFEPESPLTFFNDQIDAEITFVADDDGEIEALVLKQGGQEMRAERAPLDQCEP